MNTRKLINVAEPTSSSDAATKNYVDKNAASGIGNITTDVNLNSHKLTNVLDPTNLQDAATKSYVEVSSQKSNFLGLVPNSSFSCLGLKSQTIAGGLTNAVTVFNYSEGYGVLRRLWLALSGTGTNVPGNVYIRIYADGEIGVGNYSETTDVVGVDSVALTCDLLFSPLGGPFYANSLQGCNVFTTSSLGGYLTLDSRSEQAYP